MAKEQRLDGKIYTTMTGYIKILLIIIVLSLTAAAVVIFTKSGTPVINPITPSSVGQTPEQNLPIFIENLRNRSYPSSEIIIKETLSPGINYSRYIASYTSDGLKIYGLLTIPTSNKPEKGFPTVVFLHGYINPKQYVTTQDYIASQDGLAKNGFVTFKPDLRGHGKSEGEPSGAHFSESYIVDALNLISSLKNYQNTDPEKIGVWGHSNGGEMMLRLMVTSKDIKAGVSWAGVVGSFEDMLETHRDRIPFMRQTPQLVSVNGLPSTNLKFWSKIDPYYFLENISGPIQLHHGDSDKQVPIELSVHLKEELEKEGKVVEFYRYNGADHNFSGTAFGSAIQRSVNFFKKYL